MRVTSSQRMLGHGPSAGCNLNRANHNEPGYIMKLWHIHLQIQHGLLGNPQFEEGTHPQRAIRRSQKIERAGPQPQFLPLWWQTCSMERGGQGSSQYPGKNGWCQNHRGFLKWVPPKFPSHGPGLSAKRDDWGSPMT